MPDTVAAHFVVCGIKPPILQRNAIDQNHTTQPQSQHITHQYTILDIKALPSTIPPDAHQHLTPLKTLQTSSQPKQTSNAKIAHGIGQHNLHLFVRYEPQATTNKPENRPISDIRVVHLTRGEIIPEGYEPIKVHGTDEIAAFGTARSGSETLICITRSLSLSPLSDIISVVREKNSSDVDVPHGFQLLPYSLSSASSGHSMFLCYSRTHPIGLLNTPLRPSVIDALSANRRPVDAQNVVDKDAPTAKLDVCDSPITSEEMLPYALPHFCLPHGAFLRDTCPWPTAHEFALTDANGARMYGCCLSVWEPMSGSLVVRKERASTGMEDDVVNGTVLVESVSSAGSDEQIGRCNDSEQMSHCDDLEIRDDVEKNVVSKPTSNFDAEREEALLHCFENCTSIVWESSRVTETSITATEDADVAAAENKNNWLKLDCSNLYAPLCLCVLSYTPFFTSLRRWLCQLYRYSLTEGNAPLESIICSLLWETPIPPPGNIAVTVNLAGETISFSRPCLSRELPLAQLPLTFLLDALRPASILRLFRSALLEHKIVFVSDQLSRLTAATEALTCLMWPLRWQGVYIPILPSLLIDVFQSPVPYLLGVHTSVFEAAEHASLIPSDILLCRLDAGTLSGAEDTQHRSGQPPLPMLPHSAMLQFAIESFQGDDSKSASQQLRRAANFPVDADMAFPARAAGTQVGGDEVEETIAKDQNIRNAFANFFALTLRGYQEFLRLPPYASRIGLERLLDTNALLNTRNSVEAKFLSAVFDTQAFVRFIEQRTSFSSRDAELTLFDHIVDECANWRGGAPDDASRLSSLAKTTARRRLYVVPSFENSGESIKFGPYETWPRVSRKNLRPPRPVQPFNFATAPIQNDSNTLTSMGKDAHSSTVAPSTPVRAQTSRSLLQTPRSNLPTHRRTRSQGASLVRFAGFGARTGTDARARAASFARVPTVNSPTTPSNSKTPINVSSAARRSSWRTRLTLGSSSRLAPSRALPETPSSVEWARKALGELFASFITVFALTLETLPSSQDALNERLAQFRRLHSSKVKIPQIAHHALMQACIRAGFGQGARAVFEELLDSGSRPDAETIGWYQHALLQNGVGENAVDDSDANSPFLSPMSRETMTRSKSLSHLAPERLHGYGDDSWREGPTSPTRAEAGKQGDAADGEMLVRLRVHGSCSGCGAKLQARAAVTGWFVNHEDALAPYKSICPSCRERWQPHLNVEIFSGKSKDILERLEAEKCRQAAGVAATLQETPACAMSLQSPTTPMSTRSSVSSMPPSPVGTLDAMIFPGASEAFSPAASPCTLRSRIPAGTDVNGTRQEEIQSDRGSIRISTTGDNVECPFLSPNLLLQEISMLHQLELGAHGRQALGDGWRECRRLFPSIFWNLCWYLAPQGLLQSLPHFRLRPLPPTPSRTSPGEILMLFDPNLAVGTSERTLLDCTSPVPFPNKSSNDDDAIEADDDIDFGGWIDEGGHFLLKETRVFRNLDLNRHVRRHASPSPTPTPIRHTSY